MKNIHLNIVRIFQEEFYLVDSFFHPPAQEGIQECHRNLLRDKVMEKEIGNWQRAIGKKRSRRFAD